MEMNTWIGILFGSAVTFVFYRLSLRKKLDFLLLLNDLPLANVHQQVRERLTVSFLPPTPPDDAQGGFAQVPPVKVGAFQHLQFVVKNAGLRGIKFETSPWFELPQGTQVLDAAIVYTEPNELDATLAIQPSVPNATQKIALSIPLLNRSEYVLIKLLLADSIDANSLVLHAVAEDLVGRHFTAKQLPPEYTKGIVESFDWGAITVGCMFIASGLSSSYLGTTAFKEHPTPDFEWNRFFDFIFGLSLINISSFLAVVGGAIFVVLGVGFAYDVGFQKLALWRRVYLPPQLRPLGGQPKHVKKGT